MRKILRGILVAYCGLMVMGIGGAVDHSDVSVWWLVAWTGFTSVLIGYISLSEDLITVLKKRPVAPGRK